MKVEQSNATTNHVDTNIKGIENERLQSMELTAALISQTSEKPFSLDCNFQSHSESAIR